MTDSFSRTAKTLLILSLVAFLLFGFFGLSHSSMAMGADGNMIMSNCPFMSGQVAACKMDILEHIATWQSMFTGILSHTGSTLMLMLVAALALAFLWAHLRWPPTNRVFASTRLLVRREYVPPAPSLQELFSSGILNPKLY
mgnify:CR=1 FL=1